MKQYQKVKLVHDTLGFSIPDAKALIEKAREVHTVDEIPLEPLRENASVDSNDFVLNQIPDIIHLDRNGPR
ncbi:MAG: hypothetical protein ABS942_09830 [Solibacillus sp.]|uniref:hypothetical protein n=1 Tax=unclassified Solibacillus TaxID=2637870 RepID=UPI003100D68B